MVTRSETTLPAPLPLVASLLLLLLVPWGCAQESEPETLTATAELRDADGETVGEAILTEVDEGVRVRVRLRELTEAGEGEHGIHIHETGACSPDFQAAGGHFDPAGAEHGLENPNGPHAGDLPNLRIDEEGNASYETTTDRITLRAGERSVLAGDGTAFILHAGRDDQETDPAGDAGDRVACGVISANGEADAGSGPGSG